MRPDRDSQIRQHLFAHGPASIDELAAATGASPATIRRDLQRMAATGAIARSHGGARLADGPSPELAFAARERQHLAAKRGIGLAACARLRPGASVFLDSSTTVLQCARHLRLAPMALAVFTNSLAVAQLLVGVPGVQLTLVGGQIRPPNLSAVGPLAEAALGGLWFDLLFLGASAIAQDGTLRTTDPAEASLNALMLRRATRRCLLADASKFGPTATYAVAPLAALTDAISDPALPAAWRTRLRESGLDLLIAAPNPEPSDA